MKNKIKAMIYKWLQTNMLDPVSRCILIFMMFCLVLNLYYIFLFPTVEQYRHTENSRIIESNILYDMHNIFDGYNYVTYFNIIPLIGGDRLYITKVIDGEKEVNKVLVNIRNSNWHVMQRGEIIDLQKGNYKGIFKYDQNTNILMIGFIDTSWGEIWYKLYSWYLFYL